METTKYDKNKQNTMKFKSYYVVWKLSAAIQSLGATQSLNRTMQYGNSPMERMIAIRAAGLNRTMQYGNSTILQNPVAIGAV